MYPISHSMVNPPPAPIPRLLPRQHKGLVDGFYCFGPSLRHRQGARTSEVGEAGRKTPIFGGENQPVSGIFLHRFSLKPIHWWRSSPKTGGFSYLPQIKWMVDRGWTNQCPLAMIQCAGIHSSIPLIGHVNPWATGYRQKRDAQRCFEDVKKKSRCPTFILYFGAAGTQFWGSMIYSDLRLHPSGSIY